MEIAAKNPTLVDFPSTDTQRWLTPTFWLLAILLGGIQAWADRFAMNADGISYIEIGEAYLRGDWNAAINAYWSPLYSWLLAFGMFILHPSTYWENPTVHLVNFLIYLFALGCFHFFLGELIRFRQSRAAELPNEGAVTLPVWAWIALGYSLFIWSSLTLITIRDVTPDMCVAAFVYLASGILLRIRRGSTSWITFSFLGLVLGIGYLAKTPMLPLAFVYLGVSVLSLRNIRKAALGGLSSLLMFILVAGPFVLLLSATKGRLTFGDSAKLNYALDIAGVSLRHWQGIWPPGIGMPQHATRKIYEVPTVYEFGSPIAGTYPPWYDPSYWNEGMSPPVDFRKELSVFFANVHTYLDLFINNSQAGLITGFFILFFASGRGWFFIRDLANQWALLIPAFAAFFMYSLVHVYARFIGAFVVLLWSGVVSGVRLTSSRDSMRLATSVSFAMVTLLMMSVAVATAPKVYATTYELIRGVDPSAHVQWQVAEGLSRVGVQPGDKVAILGQGTFSFGAYWARLARVKIVAEVFTEDVDKFLAAGTSVRSQVIESFAKAGAKAVVAFKIPSDLAKDGWEKIENTDYFAYRLFTREWATLQAP
jgi:hypothetical protein